MLSMQSSITTLGEATTKVYEMEKDMLESNANLDILLGKVQCQMLSLALANQGASTSTSSTEVRWVSRGIFQGNPSNVYNLPAVEDPTHNQHDVKIGQVNQTMGQIHNELIHLRYNDEFRPRQYPKAIFPAT